MITCIRCGKQNPEGQHYCQSCKAVLPRIAETISSVSPPKITVHYDILREAGEKVQADAISLEEYLQILEDIYNKVYERLQDVETMEMEDEVRAMLQRQIEVGVSGIHSFLQGIDEMRLYAQDRDAQHIAVGISQVFQGNENLNAALEMARENLRQLKSMGVDSEISIKDEPN